MKTVEQAIKEKEARGRLVPACGGTETPITVKGFRLLYVWDTGTGKHHYLNLDTDIILSDEEALAIFF
jgi:hypothetical protein